ncbi:MAG: 50S ribosomal protein L3 [Candidatus Nanoperiomorbaceae bacterium]
MKTLLGTKIGMTQILGEDGTMTPVTIVQAGPITVTQVKTVDNDGYDAVQFGYGRGKNLSKAVAGHVKAAGEIAPSEIRETRDNLTGDEKVGDELKVDMFAIGDTVDAIGTSKGKGWAGTIKRHNFQRHRKTHGGKGNTRKVGSIGSMYPQKVFKGHPMAGQMGNERVTVKNLTVAYVNVDKNLLGVKGAIPGPKKSVVEIALAKGANHNGKAGK